MIITSNTKIQYISMDTKNLSTKKDSLPIGDTKNLSTKEDSLPIGDTDYIFLFDIDDTLYKLPEEMEIEEREKWKLAYNFYKAETPNVPSFKSLFDETTSYEEAFKLYFNKNPYEVEKVKGFMDYNKYIKKDEALKALLDSLPQRMSSIPYRMWCFTNGMKCRAEVILDCLDLASNFEGVICMEDGYLNSSFMGKPKRKAYKFVEDILNIRDKSKVYFFDDRIDNVEMGTEMGWNSILIKKDDNIVEILNGIVSGIEESLER